MQLYEISMHRYQTDVLGKINTVILPIGTIEAHGSHCPLGTDAIIPIELANRVENIIGADKVVVAPPVNYGHAWYLGQFPGTIDISSEVLGSYLHEIGKSFIRWGLTNIVFLNGHGGNTAGMSLATERLADAGAVVLTTNWWVDYKQVILEVCTAQGHAGEDETATVMAICPDLVDLSLVGKPHFTRPFGDIKAKGICRYTYPEAYSSDPSLATPEKGAQILERVAMALAAHVAALQAGHYMA